MRSTQFRFAFSSLVLALGLALGGCPGEEPPPDGGVEPEPAPAPEPEPEPEPGPAPDGGSPEPDAGPVVEPEPEPAVVTPCDDTPTPANDPGADVCAVEGTGDGLLLVGDVLTPGEVFEGGQVLLDASGDITCVGCGCVDQAGDATRVICPDAVISPGLINAHDHVGWMNDVPWVAPSNIEEVRWEHRHDWRRGTRSHPEIDHGPGGSSNDDKAYGELRFVLSGATSVFGSGSAPGLMRNLDGFSGSVPGINQPVARYETFPLGDTGGTLRSSGCDYPEIDGPQDFDAYVPHVSEGIDAEARNEFLCLTGQGTGASDTLDGQSSIIHGVGLTPIDVSLMASEGMRLIWSPRSNIALYGDTAPLTMFDRLGVSIGLGTDWIPSGSMNMLRELQCADYLNAEHFGGYFSDEKLWQMATLGSARALAMDDAIGVLATGRAGDIAVFAKSGRASYRAVIDAGLEDVALVLRGGDVLSGNSAVVAALDAGCEDIGDVCGASKRVCLEREVGSTLSALESSINPAYPLFFCDTPADEPTCVPARTLDGDRVDGSNNYDGVSRADDQDGDGVPDAEDNCPSIFNPIRPVDDGSQGDRDNDDVGDVCDPCPLDADTADCTVFDPDDPDGDGEPSLTDNCPDDPNADQLDGDEDGKGDVCDPCPDFANPGGGGCLSTIPDVKTDGSLQGTRIALEDVVVTAVDPNGYFIQVNEDPAPDHAGVFVFDPTTPPAEGALLDITGATVDTFFDQIQLSDITYTELGSTVQLTPRLLTPSEVTTMTGTDTYASPFEGMLVAVENVSVTDADPEGGPGDNNNLNEFEVTGALRIDDGLFPLGATFIDPLPDVGEVLARVVGPVSYRNTFMKLLPRTLNDVVFADASLREFAPALAFQRVGTTGDTFPAALTISLTRATSDALTVEVTSDDAGIVAVPGSPFTIPAGETSVVVPVEGVSAGTTTLRANLEGDAAEVTAEVRALADDEIPDVASIEPGTAQVLTEGVQTFTVTLAFPAPVAGVDVTLGADPAVGTVPGTLTFPADTQSATFDLTAASDVGSGEVTATLGVSVSADVDVIDVPPRLIINEVDYDQPGTDTEEFVELYNTGAGPLALAGLELRLVNGNNDSTYTTVDLSEAAAEIPGNGYLVVATSAVTVDPGALSIEFSVSSNAVQNGDPDGMAVYDTNAGTIVDALSYEGAITSWSEGSLVEGTATTVEDNNSSAGSLCRSPNGLDTDDASVDWAFCTTPTPGTANAN